jgi:phosphodiesterase/alkaline phosphatase D-like protein
MPVTHVSASVGTAFSGDLVTVTTLAVPLATAATVGNLVVAAHGIDKAAGTITSDPDFTVAHSHSYTGTSLLAEFRAATGNATDTATPNWGTARETVAAVVEFTLASPVAAQTLHSGQTTATTVSVTGTASAAGLAVVMASIDTALGSAPQPWGTGYPTLSSGWTTAVVHRGGTSSPGVLVGYREVASGGSLDCTLTQAAADETALCLTLFTGTPTAPVPTASRRITGVDGRVSVRVTDTTSVRLRTAPEGEAITTSSTGGASATPNAQGDVLLSVPAGLAAGAYDYRIEMTDAAGGLVLDGFASPGRFRVYATGTPVDHTFGLGSCADGDSSAFIALAALNLDFFRHMGDLYYDDAATPSISELRSHIHTAFAGANMQTLVSRTPLSLTSDDHEALGNNTTGGEGSSTEDIDGWTYYNQAYREMVPNSPAAASGIYHSWVVGRVRHVALDCKTFMTDPDLYPGSGHVSKTILGAAQKTWLTNLAASSTEPVWIVGVSFPFFDYPHDGEDTWGSYTVERQWLCDLLDEAGIWWVAIAGDMHAIAYHDGTVSTSNPGGILVFQAAPLQRTSSVKGGIDGNGAGFTAGPWYQGALGSTSRQFGVLEVTDDGTEIALEFTGRAVDGAGAVTATFGPYAVSFAPPVEPPPTPIPGSTSADGSPAVVIELVSGATYDVSVTAANEAGSGPPSTAVRVTLPAGTWDELLAHTWADMSTGTTWAGLAPPS